MTTRPIDTGPRTPPTFAAWLAAITAVGAALRLFRLDAQCVWLDESWSYGMARIAGESGPLAVAEHDNTAPLQFWMIAALRGLGVDPVVALRLPSALFGTLAIPLTGALGRRMFRSDAVGLAAALLTAFSPFAVWYSQDGRMYAILMGLGVAFVSAFWAMLEGPPRPRHWAAMAALMVASLYTHQLGALVSIACGLYLLGRVGLSDRRLWLYAATQVAAALAFAPWVVLARRAMARIVPGFPKGDAALWVPYAFFTQVFGLSFGPSIRELRGGAMAALRSDLPWILAPAIGAAWVGLLGLRRALRAGDTGAGRLCLTWIAVPTALVVAASLTGRLNFNARYLAGVFPATTLLLACGVVEARRSAAGRVASALLAGGMLLSLYQWYASPRYAKEEVRGVAARLGRDADPGDLVILASRSAEAPLQFYGFEPPEGILRVGAPGAGTTAEEAVRALEEAEAAGPGRRVWLVEHRTWEGDPTGRIRRWLDDRARPLDGQSWPGVSLRLYQLPGPATAVEPEDRAAPPRS